MTAAANRTHDRAENRISTSFLISGLQSLVIVRLEGGAGGGDDAVTLAHAATFPALREVNRFQLEVRLEPFEAALTSPARLLEAAERHLWIDDHAVHGHAAGTHAARDLVAALLVRRVHGAVQAVHRAVRFLDGVVDVLVGDERHDGSKDLLARDCHRLVDVAEHGWLDEVATVEAFRPAAAEDELRALGLALADVALHALELPFHRERAHFRRLTLRLV